MTAVLHRHRRNVQLLLDARADPWKTTPIVSLCDHPWYWFGFLSRHESVNAVQVSFVQGSEDTVADLLPNDTQIQQSAGDTAHPSFDDTAMTDHAKLLLGNLVQKYCSTRPHLMRGCYTSHRWRLFWKASTCLFESEKNFVVLLDWSGLERYWIK